MERTYPVSPDEARVSMDTSDALGRPDVCSKAGKGSEAPGRAVLYWEKASCAL